MGGRVDGVARAGGSVACGERLRPRAGGDGLPRVDDGLARWVGPLPFRRSHVVSRGDRGPEVGGLEHAAGCSVIVPSSLLGRSWPGPAKLGATVQPLVMYWVMAHELFHVFNAKLIRPAAYLRYDYPAPGSTDMLWWFEGATEYFAHRSMLAAGLLTPSDYRDRLGKVMEEMDTKSASARSLETSARRNTCACCRR